MNQEAFQIVPADREDAFGVAKVHVQAWREAYRGLIPAVVLESLSVSQRTETWRAILQDETNRTFLACGGGREVLAFINLGPYRDGDLEGAGLVELRALYVRPDQWRAGIGGALVELALGECRAMGARQVVLWVLASNEAAKAFYRVMGFQLDGGTKVERMQGDLVLGEERMSLLL
jgi:GNAT superfamily N-acetyltransferase